jgi:hypothetical protein
MIVATQSGLLGLGTPGNTGRVLIMVSERQGNLP